MSYEKYGACHAVATLKKCIQDNLCGACPENNGTSIVCGSYKACDGVVLLHNGTTCTDFIISSNVATCSENNRNAIAMEVIMYITFSFVGLVVISTAFICMYSWLKGCKKRKGVTDEERRVLLQPIEKVSVQAENSENSDPDYREIDIGIDGVLSKYGD